MPRLLVWLVLTAHTVLLLMLLAGNLTGEFLAMVCS